MRQKIMEDPGQETKIVIGINTKAGTEQDDKKKEDLR